MKTLREEFTMSRLFTVGEAAGLLGRRVRLGHGESSDLTIWILGMTEDGRGYDEREAGKILRFRLEVNGRVEERQCDWIYEREGAFRIGSEAEALYILEVYP